MKQKIQIPLILLCLPILLLACTLEQLSTATPTPAEPLLTINGILQDYIPYADQLVRVRGYGVIEAMMPLCPGYVGIDKRTVFVDEENNNITARLAGNLWEAMQGSVLRDFLGYVRVFSGELGCPGSVGIVSFPYFEIVEVVGSE
jgi:hypothetical protein